ncbi:PD-(D/E)XK nuclease-like domain-containing protein [Burkholderia multivorans]|uniref:PD-(D/E)XK nuclease-like domain-containing protein n=1 Tax=Burkholderia multivorans TaxID=87883 RepID=UPI00285E5E9E|nr:PD-(D/E)XK nuclease-like domain-containing protein [Burkholderia multivorans]MDR9060660.1 Exodeoxyribonuclease 8 [Burkholderia multivorans]MDR9084164.1 Exodeoxyribonuclease 8 [Burkholderia multivorans]MDR9095097.1 Exodeoxyribonuclease 8 [Burkholderia multivorans]MDR9101533.1 Exodeoxyribonuclease 8 [Burkholderia multivorans]MDR9108011.1 Exodeoxyribonuclease 8 [Burkholderia multivorans]
MKIENVGLLSMPADQYHAHSAVGHSGLVRIMRSPAHYREYVTNPPSPTPAMQLGTAFHVALLEPDRLGETFVVAPKFDRRTKEGKAAAEAWEAENAGKTPLTADQMAAIEQMVVSVRSHQGAANLLASGMAEMSGFWTDPDTGIQCKCRPDWVVTMEDRPDWITAIVDVKTCRDASADGFARAIATLGYDVQAAFYQDGLKALTGRSVPFYYIAVETEPPFAVAAYKASDEMIEVGRTKYRGALQLLKWCRENDRWPGYQPNGEIETVNLPRWAANFDLEG